MTRPKKAEFKCQTIEKGYCRVGFRCSMPSCRKSLIGPAENKKGYIKTGEACHIYAASPGGPRYDEKMTDIERSDFDNLIILCREHATIIDKDPNSFSAEKLKEWKKDAETFTKQELLSTNFFDKTTNEIDAEFGSLWINAEYKLIRDKINNYKYDLNVEKNKIIFKYRILIELVTENSFKSLNEYFDLYHEYPDEVIEYLIETINKDALQNLNIDGIKCYQEKINLVLSKKIIEISKNAEDIQVLNKGKENLDIKLIMNYIIYDDYLSFIIGTDDIEQPFYEETKYYEILSNVLKIKRVTVLFHKNKEENFNELYYKIVKDLNIIQTLYTNLKIRIYEIVLKFLMIKMPKEFDNFYSGLLEEERNNISIRNIWYQHKLHLKETLFDLEKIINHCKEINNYTVALLFVLNLTREEAKNVIEDNLFLLKKDVRFLAMYCDLLSFEQSTILLEKYYMEFNLNFTYNSLCWKYGYNKEYAKKYCVEHENEVELSCLMQYFENLIGDKMYDNVMSLIEKVDNLMIVKDALLLLHSKIDDDYYDDVLFEKYQFLLKNEIKNIGIRHNLALLLIKKTKYEEATKYLYEEIDEFNSLSSLRALINLRITNNLFVIDKYFEMCKQYNEKMFLWYIAKTLYINNKYEESLKYFIKCLLVDKINSNAYLWYIFDICRNEKFLKIEEITPGCLVRLHHQDENLIIAFHKQEIIENLSNINNSEEFNTSLEKEDFSHFNFKCIGEQVEYNGRKYVIDSIENIYDYYCKKAMNAFITNPGTIKISGSTEESIEQIKSILNIENKKTLELFDSYDSLTIKPPLSLSTIHMFNSKILNNLDYLFYACKKRIINNLILLDTDLSNYDKVILFSDTVYVLYHLKMDFPNIIIPKNFYIPKQIVEVLTNEIKDAIRENSHSDGTGSIAFVNNSLTIFESNSKYRNNRYLYLTDFLTFINSFSSTDGFDYDFGGIFPEKQMGKLLIEKGTLGLYDNNHNSIILTEDSFLTAYCKFKKYRYIGITSVVCYLSNDEDTIVDIVKKLKKMNYNNYFPIMIYLELRKCKKRELLSFFFNSCFETPEENNQHKLLLYILYKELQKFKVYDEDKDKELVTYLIGLLEK